MTTVDQKWNLPVKKVNNLFPDISMFLIDAALLSFLIFLSTEVLKFPILLTMFLKVNTPSLHDMLSRLLV